MFWLISHSIRVGILLADHFGMFWENLATNNCVTWDSRIFQMFTPRECIRFNFSYTIRNSNRGEGRTPRECTISNPS